MNAKSVKKINMKFKYIILYYFIFKKYLKKNEGYKLFRSKANMWITKIGNIRLKRGIL